MAVAFRKLKMAEQNNRLKIFLSAAEASGDSHCAGLITALKSRHKNIEFVGVGGPKMAAAGCEVLEETVDQAAMIYKAFSRVAYFIKLIRRIRLFFKTEKFDLVVVCDSPAFNFHVAMAAKKVGIKTVFYVAPQLWAWAEWRIDKLRRYCDKLLCMLPFELEWFSQRGIDTVFVGNPLLDELAGSGDIYKRDYRNFEPKDLQITLLPGSRQAEIESLWQPMQRIAVRLKRKYKTANITAVAVDEKGKEALKSMQVLGFRCKYILGSVTEAAGTADFAIAASGSAALQIAAVGCPMVIMYQSSRILWHLIGRWLIKTKNLSLVNILAEHELVPEFMPYFKSIDPITAKIKQLLDDKDKLTELSSQLVELTRPLTAAVASQKAAQAITEMLTGDEK